MPLEDITPVILAGGAGRRLRPFSTKKAPKPFVKFPFWKHTMLQQTALRLQGMRDPVIVCNARHRELAGVQLRDAGVRPARMLLEPAGRNTAPAIAAAAHYMARDPQGLMLILPSDHAVANVGALRGAVAEGVALAREGKIVTFGIAPDSVQTRYGYIRTRDCKFHEKPDRKTARAFLREGGWFWNSGIFLMSAQTALAAFTQFCPATHDAAHNALHRGSCLQDAVFLQDEAFGTAEPQSFDKAVMEKACNIALIPVAGTAWRDMGTFGGLAASLLPR